MDGEKLKGAVDALQAELVALESRSKAVKAAIAGLQVICPHEERLDDGHDSHYSYWKCAHCGHTERC